MDGTFINIDPSSDFSIHNLPYGIFSTVENPAPRMGVAIGDMVLDLEQIHCFTGPEMARQTSIFQKDRLNDFIGLGSSAWSETRQTLQRILSGNEGYLRDDRHLQTRALVPRRNCKMYLPLQIGNFTDFSASKQHAENDRIMFTDNNERVLPNWSYMPVAYHSRASSVVVSEQSIRRPHGQYEAVLEECAAGPMPVFGPTKKLDFEMEIGAIIGTGNALGHPITVDQADAHVFGFVLLNDWSARDIQSWEWRPLGPFLCKNFATTISPWIITRSALEPFACPTFYSQDPKPLPYLYAKSLTTYNINVTASLKTSSQTAVRDAPTMLSQSNYKYMYWTLAQQIAHHTSNGCNLLPGDLIGSGTVSGPTHSSSGSLSELSQRGTVPVDVGNGVSRGFLEDGDEVTIQGWCQQDGIRVGFGHCRGTILPAVTTQ